MTTVTQAQRDVVRRQFDTAAEIAQRMTGGEPYTDTDVQQLAEAVAYVAGFPSALSALERPEPLPAVRSALNSLANNAAGIWSSYEHSLRAAMGNTNYQVVADCIVDARAALDAKATPSALQAERIAALECDADTRIAIWMTERGYATGHGDAIEDLLAELEGYAIERDIKQGRDEERAAQTDLSLFDEQAASPSPAQGPALENPEPSAGTKALLYAQRLAQALWEKHWRNDAPKWKPLPELIGTLTQIDNMTVGLVRASPSPAQGWQPIETAPKDGTLLLLLVEADQDSEDSSNPTENEILYRTIGQNNFDHDDRDVWEFAGWCWQHDHWVAGRGTPVMWQPMPVAPPADQVPAGYDVRARASMVAEQRRGP